MANTYLTRTPSSNGNLKKWTLSMWAKRSGLGQLALSFAWVSGNEHTYMQFNGSDQLLFGYYNSGGGSWGHTTTRVFRDTSAWYHFQFELDTSLSSGGDRAKIYVNGIRETAFASSTDPGQNTDTAYGKAVAHYIGSTGDSQKYWDGSMANVEFVDGQAYGPAYFGSTNTATGIWTPSGATAISDYGTNGFKLKMDTTSPGADTSGKGNTFTASGTPTLLQGNPQNNWATWNVLQSQYFWGAAETSFATNGNTTLGSGTSQYGFISGTMGISKGKWYWETKINSETGGSQFLLGIASTMPRSATNHLGGNQYDYGMYSQNGNIYTSNASSSFAASYTVGDILSIAIDYDNAKLYFAKNGAWSTGSGAWGSSTFNAATGAKTITTPPPKPTATPGVGTGFYFPAFSYWDGSNRGFISTNFGEGFFGTTAAGTNADDNGQGLFAYDVPAGYYAMNTKNLEAYG